MLRHTLTRLLLLLSVASFLGTYGVYAQPPGQSQSQPISSKIVLYVHTPPQPLPWSAGSYRFSGTNWQLYGSVGQPSFLPQDDQSAIPGPFSLLVFRSG
jgi:hypothetical protein